MFKKLICLLLAIGLTAAVFTGCSRDGASANESGPTSASALATSTQTATKAEPVKITIAHCQGEVVWPVLEELAKEYSTKTGNTVEWNYIPADGYNEWQQAQLLAGTEPDIFWNLDKFSDAFKNGQIIDLAEYVDGVSPYTGKPWKESFHDGILEGCYDKTLGNAMLGIPAYLVTVNLYYDKNVFKDAGLPDAAPQSWGEVLAICKKIKDSGKDIVPFSVMNSIPWNLSWITGKFLEDVYANSGVLEKLDLINPNGKLDEAEVALGVKTGLLDPTDQRFIDYFKFLKDLSVYFPTGFNTLAWEYEKFFNEGKAAMQLNGSWYPNQYLTGKFTNNYGVGAVPYVDDSVSKLSRNQQVLHTVGEVSPSLIITTKAKNEGRADAAVDFLRYWTDPKTGAKLFAERTMNIPCVKDVPVPEGMKGIMDSIGSIEMKYYLYRIFDLTAELKKQYEDMLKVYLEDQTTPEQFAAKVKDIMLKAVDQYITDKPEAKVSEFIDKVQK